MTDTMPLIGFGSGAMFIHVVHAFNVAAKENKVLIDGAWKANYAVIVGVEIGSWSPLASCGAG